MTNSIEITSIDDQISLLPQIEKDEIEEGRKVDHLMSQTKKSINQIFDEMFEDLDNSSIKSCTIFKVNVWLCESNPDAYTPKMVSIGPYHKKTSQLHPMKKYKLSYLRRFLKRKGLDVESCINELEELKEKAIKCYEDIEDLDTDEFCQMLLLDGCFVVDFIREYWGMCPEGEDMIINNKFSYIFRDLMLLENQLPFFVLDKLHHMTMQDDELPLAILLSGFPFISDFTKMTFIIIDLFTNMTFRETVCNAGNSKHLLHVVHLLTCGNAAKKSNDDKTNQFKGMPNATELSEAGVSFVKEDKPGYNTNFFDSITFEKGLMKIPCFQVNDETEILLRNLIAYEQQSVDVRPKYFSDFAMFMDYLIDSDKDVTLLRQKGIIQNYIGDDKEVARIFNKIGNGFSVFNPNDFYYNEECIKASRHCEKWWNKMKASLKHNYFSSPWVGASTVAAIILLILTAIQTILAFTGSIK